MRVSAPHIAIVDDEPDITRLLASYLASHGLRASQLHSGRALMALMASDAPDLVLLDLGLPGEDGFVIARQLQLLLCSALLRRGRGEGASHRRGERLRIRLAQVVGRAASHAVHRRRVARAGAEDEQRSLSGDLEGAAEEDCADLEVGGDQGEPTREESAELVLAARDLDPSLEAGAAARSVQELEA